MRQTQRASLTPNIYLRGLLTDKSTSAVLVSDIILSYRPSLSYSLPLQVLLFTIICTIILVLCVHLAFTSSTHWSLSPSSFSLQLSASVFFLSTHGAMLIMVLKIASRQTLKWPYMFSWVAVEIPPQIPPVWSRARVITWCVARTISSALVQVSVKFLFLFLHYILIHKL